MMAMASIGVVTTVGADCGRGAARFCNRFWHSALVKIESQPGSGCAGEEPGRTRTATAEAFNSMAAKLREYRRTNRAKLVRTQATTQNAINGTPDVPWRSLIPTNAVEIANSAAAQRLFALRPKAHVSELHAEWLVELFRRTSTDLKGVEPRGYESVIQVLDEGGGERFAPAACSAGSR